MQTKWKIMILFLKQFSFITELPSPWNLRKKIPRRVSGDISIQGTIPTKLFLNLLNLTWSKNFFFSKRFRLRSKCNMRKTNNVSVYIPFLCVELKCAILYLSVLNHLKQTWHWLFCWVQCISLKCRLAFALMVNSFWHT